MTDEYDWLFVHAFRICLGKSAGIAKTGQIDQTLLEVGDEDQQEHAAAATILGWSALHLLSTSKKEVENAINALIEIETQPPIMEDHVPFLILFGSYDRSCRGDACFPGVNKRCVVASRNRRARFRPFVVYSSLPTTSVRRRAQKCQPIKTNLALQCTCIIGFSEGLSFVS